MSVVVEPVTSTIEDATAPRGRRRWPWVILGLALVTAGAVALGAWVWTGHYQPLAGRGYISVQSQDVETQWKDNAFGTEVILLKPKGGETASAQFQLWNEGKYAVTVQSLGLDSWVGSDDTVGSLDETTTRVRVDERFLKTDPYTPRQLAAGDYMTITLTMTFADCPKLSDGSTGTEFVPVTYSAFGRTHTVDVPLGYALTVKNPPQCSSG